MRIRIHKPCQIAHVEALIVAALRDDEFGRYMSTTRLTESPHILRHFHGMSTLNTRQIGRICKRMVEDGRLETAYAGEGMYRSTVYRLHNA
jgi:hypothetical protein